MTTLTSGANGATNNFDSSQLIGLSTATLGTHTTTTFTLTVDVFTVVGQGTGFTYSNGHPSGGTLTALSVDTNGTPASWSGFSVSVASLWNAISVGDTTTFNNLFFSGNDTFNLQASHSPDFLSGYGGNDTFNYADYFSDVTQIDGGAGADSLNLNGDYGFCGLGYITNVETINLGGGHDYDLAMSPTSAVTVNGSALGVGDVLKFDGGWSGGGSLLVTGGSGSDTFISGHGNDTFNGGLGADTVDYSHASSSVTVDLSLIAAQPVGGGAGSDTLISVENIIGSGNDDTLTGNASDNVLIGGDGHDTLDGGAGNDTVSYQDFQLVTGSQLITIDLRDNGAQNLGSDRLISIEKVVGSVYSDTFIGSAADNVFDGGGIPFHYNDRVDYQFATGGMAFTVLSFVDGNETVAASGGGQGTDTLINFSSITGTPFDDVYYPLADFMSPDFDGGAGDDTISLEKFTSAGSLDISNVNSIEKIVGSAFDDVLGGDAQISGGAGDDTITGGNGDSTFYGNDGNDVIAGQGGSDTIYGGAGDDVLSGGGYALRYTGNDQIYGGDGNDTLFSGGLDGENLGNIRMDGGRGDDTFWGADGRDTVTYQDATGGVTVDLSRTDAQAVGGGWGNDTLHYIDNLIGSSFDDVLTSGDEDNVLAGGDGNDILDLSGWHDQFVSAGHDTAYGGTGVDTVSYYHARDGVTVSLAVTTAQAVGGGGPGGGAVDTLSSIENLIGSIFDDTLSGSAGTNVISTLSGDDTVKGLGGNDTIQLDSWFTAADKIDGGSGQDTLDLKGDYSASVTFGATTLVNVEQILLGSGFSYKLATDDATVAAGQVLTVDGSALGVSNGLIFDGSAELNGSFNLSGGAGDDQLIGGAKADSLRGGKGADALTGGGGADTFVYATALESTGKHCDTLVGFDFANDKLDIAQQVLGIDTAIVTGRLKASHFDADLAKAVDAAHLASHHAVLFTPDSGGFAGETFLVIDSNGIAGYQRGEDLVLHLDAGTSLVKLDISDFI